MWVEDRTLATLRERHMILAADRCPLWHATIATVQWVRSPHALAQHHVLARGKKDHWLHLFEDVLLLTPLLSKAKSKSSGNARAATEPQAQGRSTSRTSTTNCRTVDDLQLYDIEESMLLSLSELQEVEAGLASSSAGSTGSSETDGQQSSKQGQYQLNLKFATVRAKKGAVSQRNISENGTSVGEATLPPRQPTAVATLWFRTTLEVHVFLNALTFLSPFAIANAEGSLTGALQLSPHRLEDVLCLFQGGELPFLVEPLSTGKKKEQTSTSTGSSGRSTTTSTDTERTRTHCGWREEFLELYPWFAIDIRHQVQQQNSSPTGTNPTASSGSGLPGLGKSRPSSLLLDGRGDAASSARTVRHRPAVMGAVCYNGVTWRWWPQLSAKTSWLERHHLILSEIVGRQLITTGAGANSGEDDEVILAVAPEGEGGTVVTSKSIYHWSDGAKGTDAVNSLASGRTDVHSFAEVIMIHRQARGMLVITPENSSTPSGPAHTFLLTGNPVVLLNVFYHWLSLAATLSGTVGVLQHDDEGYPSRGNMYGTTNDVEPPPPPPPPPPDTNTGSGTSTSTRSGGLSRNAFLSSAVCLEQPTTRGEEEEEEPQQECRVKQLEQASLNILKRLHQQFASMETSGDGLVDEEELHVALSAMVASSGFVTALFDAFDENRDGFITFIEFARGMSDLLFGDYDSRLKFVFRMYNRTNNPQGVDANEFQEVLLVLQTTGEFQLQSGTLDEVGANLFSMIDSTKKGRITHSEYTASIRSQRQIFELLNSAGCVASLFRCLNDAGGTMSGSSGRTAGGQQHRLQMNHDEQTVIFLGDPDWILTTALVQALVVSTMSAESVSLDEEQPRSRPRTISRTRANDFGGGTERRLRTATRVFFKKGASPIQQVLSLSKEKKAEAEERDDEDTEDDPFQAVVKFQVRIPSQVVSASGVDSEKLLNHIRQHTANDDDTGQTNGPGAESSPQLYSFASCVFDAVCEALYISSDEKRRSLGLNEAVGHLLLGSNQCLKRLHRGSARVEASGSHVGGSGCQPGNFCFLSHDHNLLVKGVQEEEALNLLQGLTLYAKHLDQNKHTLLPRYIGLFAITHPEAPHKALLFVLQLNPLRASANIPTVFCLRGAAQTPPDAPEGAFPLKRTRAEADKPWVMDESEFRKAVVLAEDWAATLHEQLALDTALLLELGASNYSFLLASSDPELGQCRQRREPTVQTRTMREAKSHPWWWNLCCASAATKGEGTTTGAGGGGGSRPGGYDNEGIEESAELLTLREKKGFPCSDEHAAVLLARGPKTDRHQTTSTRGLSATFGRPAWWEETLESCRFRLQSGGTPTAGGHLTFFSLSSAFVGHRPKRTDRSHHHHQHHNARYRQNLLDYLRLMILNGEEDAEPPTVPLVGMEVALHPKAKQQAEGTGSAVLGAIVSSPHRELRLDKHQIAFDVQRESGSHALVVVDTFHETLAIRPKVSASERCSMVFRLGPKSGFSIVRRANVVASRKAIMLRDVLRLDKADPEFNRLCVLLMNTEDDADYLMRIAAEMNRPTRATTIGRPTAELSGSFSSVASDMSLASTGSLSMAFGGPGLDALSQSASIGVFSFDVGCVPPQGLTGWLRKAWDPTQCDVLFVAARNCRYAPGQAFNTNEEDWFAQVDKALPGFTCLERAVASTTRLYLFVRNRVAFNVSCVERCAVEAQQAQHKNRKAAAGAEGISPCPTEDEKEKKEPTKTASGSRDNSTFPEACAIALKFQESTILCASFDLDPSQHCAAADSMDNWKDSTREVIAAMLSRLNDKMGSRGIGILNDHHHCFWTGGIRRPPANTATAGSSPVGSPTGRKLKKSRRSAAIESDASAKELFPYALRKWHIFPSFNEPLLTTTATEGHQVVDDEFQATATAFPPSYPYAVSVRSRSGCLQGAQARRPDPALGPPFYCTRILHKPLGHPLEELVERPSYGKGTGNIGTSPHNPVSARFVIRARLPFPIKQIIGETDRKASSRCRLLKIQNLRAKDLHRVSKVGLSSPRVVVHGNLFSLGVTEGARSTRDCPMTVNPTWYDLLILPLRELVPAELFQEYLYFEIVDGVVGTPLGQAVVSLHVLQPIFQSRVVDDGRQSPDGGESREIATASCPFDSRQSDISLGVDLTAPVRRFGEYEGTLSFTITLTVSLPKNSSRTESSKRKS